MEVDEDLSFNGVFVCFFVIYEKSRTLVSLYIEYPNCLTKWSISSVDFIGFFKLFCPFTFIMIFVSLGTCLGNKKNAIWRGFSFVKVVYTAQWSGHLCKGCFGNFWAWQLRTTILNVLFFIFLQVLQLVGLSFLARYYLFVFAKSNIFF